MLAQILAIAVGLGSFAVYMAAFFFPEVHRKNDFFWSGVGFFYALILWLCAGRLTGAVLLGQVASVALLGWFALQTLYLRRAVTPASQQTPVPPKLQERASGLFAVQAEEKSLIPTPTVESLDQDTIPPVAVQAPTESVAVEPQPETVETEPEVPTSSEIPEVLEDVPPTVETVSTSETEIEVEDEPVAETSEPEITSETEIDVEDEPIAETSEPEPTSETEIEVEDKVTEETIETTPQPKRLSRLFQSITGIFNRRKKTASPSPVETSAENQPETLPETASEELTVESVTEPFESSEVVEAEPIETREIDSFSNPENASETEIEEITVTVEPETSSVSPFEQMQSDPEEKEEKSTRSDEAAETIQPQEPSEEIVSKPIESQEPSEVESSLETESSSSDDNPALKRPNPPDPKLKEAAKKQSSESSDSEN